MYARVVVLLLLSWSAVARAEPADATLPSGFYRDDKDRLMQVSFDLQRRLWLGVAYAPRRRANGTDELTPAAFEFGLIQEDHSHDGRTRHRLRFMEGEARLNPFGLDVAAVRYDLSHAYEIPLLRITTLWGRPARHDLNLDVGFFSEVLRFQVEPLGEPGNHELTLARFEATLDLWQSWDLRSYVRLRLGPGMHLRFGPWRQETVLFTSLPETALEANFILGRRALQQLRLLVRGEWLRKLALPASPLASGWLVEGEASYEIILIAINDQPVSLRLAGRAAARERGVPVIERTPAWDWTMTAGVRISFFSPPVAPSPRR